MSGNTKDWRWCKHGRHWVFEFPLGVDQTCGQCLLAWINAPKEKAESKQADNPTELEALERCIKALHYVKRWWDETGRNENWHTSIGIHIDEALSLASKIKKL